MSRGDVVLVRFPHSSGGRGKRRPAVVVQADCYSAVVGTLVVAEVTSALVSEKSLLTEAATADELDRSETFQRRIVWHWCCVTSVRRQSLMMQRLARSVVLHHPNVRCATELEHTLGGGVGVHRAMELDE